MPSQPNENTAKTTSISTWLEGRALSDWQKQFDQEGFIVFERVLNAAQVMEIRAALAPYLQKDIVGRNEFEGHKSNRIYALLGKLRVFDPLVTHPLAMAFVETELGLDCLLSACLAINLHPGESAQPWHFDDSHYQWPRPRPSLGVSTFWAIDDLTEINGATEILPGSHQWPDNHIDGSVNENDFAPQMEREGDPGARDDAFKVTMPAGSLMIAKGTLWHRGGANQSTASRLIVTPQYCPGWTRPLENM